MRKLNLLENSKAPAAVRLVTILNYIAEHSDASFSEISNALIIPKSSTHHLLEVLTASNLLRQRVDGRYVLGMKLFELGGLAVRHSDIRLEAIPFMHELVSLTGLTCHLGVLEGTEGFFLGKVESPSTFIRTSWEGKQIRFNSMSLGKILLAWLPDYLIDEILKKHTFIQETTKTITNKEAYLAHLKEVKQQGWAIDDGENIREICCFAAPIFNGKGDVVAALGITGMLSQYTGDKKAQHLTSLLKISKKLSNTISFGLSKK